MEDATDKQPWERIEGETDKAFAAFQVYLCLGPARSIDIAWRSITPTAEPRQRAPRWWLTWSSKYRWVSRTQAYDDHMASLYRAEHEDINLRIVEKSKRTIERAIDKSYNLLDTAGDLREIATSLNSIANSLKLFQPAQAQEAGPARVEYNDPWLESDDG